MDCVACFRVFNSCYWSSFFCQHIFVFTWFSVWKFEGYFICRYVNTFNFFTVWWCCNNISAFAQFEFELFFSKFFTNQFFSCFNDSFCWRNFISICKLTSWIWFCDSRYKFTFTIIYYWDMDCVACFRVFNSCYWSSFFCQHIFVFTWFSVWKFEGYFICRYVNTFNFFTVWWCCNNISAFTQFEFELFFSKFFTY